MTINITISSKGHSGFKIYLEYLFNFEEIDQKIQIIDYFTMIVK